MGLRDEIRSWLSGYRLLIILGVGNPLRGDDAVGLEILRRLRGRVPRNVRLIYGGTSPENFISKISRLRPSHVLIIDAAIFGGEPGETRLIPPEQVPDETISTHTIPISVLASLIQKETNAKVMLLGIEPKNLGLGEGMSQEVSRAIELCAIDLISVLGESLGGGSEAS